MSDGKKIVIYIGDALPNHGVKNGDKLFVLKKLSQMVKVSPVRGGESFYISSKDIREDARQIPVD
ncbi:hypothetical protein KKF32_03190 [Patescibacteria group bacterium]|nr:hypothetical protein [Patescibacteria group bacterium]